jgi:hypothetical protein
MQRTHIGDAFGSEKLLGAALILGLTAWFGTPSSSAASVPGTLTTLVGPVGPTQLHAGSFADITATPAILNVGANYGGKTSQGDPLVLAVSRKAARVRRVAIDIEAACTSGSSLSTGGVLATNLRVSKTGGFKGTLLSSIDAGTEAGAVTVDLKGTLGSSRGSGTAHVHVAFIDKQTNVPTDACDTGGLRWRATTAKGRVYGGSTSQQDPVVVELSRDRRRVSALRIGWQATCSPPGGIHVIDTLNRFPLSASGAFGDTFSMTVPADGGGQHRLDFVVHGRVRKTKAVGRIQVHVTSTDAAGATVRTCDSGVVSWGATSG